MCLNYDRRTYNDCRPCIVLSDLLPLTHFTVVYSIKPKTKAKVTRKHWLNYWHRCSNRCKRRLMHRIDAHPFNFNHTTVYSHSVIACDGNTIYICTKSDNTAVTTHLMFISYYKCWIHCRKMLRLCFGAMTDVLIMIVGHAYYCQICYL